MAQNDSAGYSAGAKSLHWLVVVLVLSQFVVSYLMPHIGRNAVPGTLINLHFSLGVLIVVVMVVRLAQRLANPVPSSVVGSPAWERMAAKTAHWAFYLVLIVAPFLGWAAASAHNLPVAFFGIPLPAIAAPKAPWALTAGDIHAYTMWTLLGLVTLHALAALYHHYVKHDGLLRRMLPNKGV